MGTRPRLPEQGLHRAAAQYLDAVLPDNALWWHTPSGGYRRRTEAAIFTGLGVKAGIPDLLILSRGKLLAVELKSEGGKLTPAQKAMHQRLMLAGAVVTTVTSLDELDGFLGQLVPLMGRVGGAKAVRMPLVRVDGIPGVQSSTRRHQSPPRPPQANRSLTDE